MKRGRVVDPAVSAAQYVLAYGVGVPLILARRAARTALGRTLPKRPETVEPPNRA